MMELFGLEHLSWEACGGANSYKEGFRSGAIRISFNGITEDMGVCIDLSGQACREFESLGHGDYDRIFSEVLDNKDEMNVTRLDVAFDDKDGLIDWERLCWDTIAKDENGRPTEFVSKFHKARVEWGVPANTEGNTIYWGSKKSQFFIRAYDKAKERGFYDQHWIRFELEMRKPYPMNWIIQGYTGDKLREGLLGVLREYVRYVDDPGTDSNRWRWPMKSYWEDLIDQVGRITLFVKPGVEYNIRQLDHYVFDQAVNAIGASIDIYGAPFFMEQIQRKRSENPKYRKLVEQYGKDKSKMRAAFRQGSDVHRELPGGELLPEAGELCPGHGRTPGTAGTGLGASECGDP